MIIIGLGQGLILSPITISVEDLSNNVSGIASSIINVMLQLGSAFALAILAIFTNSMAALVSFRIQLLGCTLFGIISLFIALYFFTLIKKNNP